MSPRAAIAAGLLVAIAAVPLAAASAATTKAKPKAPVATVLKSRHLWATVNVCDPSTPPPGIPDTIGVRASMPGAADGREIMYMRFRVQFLSDTDQKWHNVTQGGDSGWTKVGFARYKARQSGRNFRLSPPPGKTSITLRGKVNFEWRLKGEVVRQAVEVTTKGHKSSAGSYPAGYTEATCTITT
ncbi:MAG TPA: hypothetical protein VHZ31_09550 [Solirubrobacteraceae bacterium]|nr:hypothetical protein [Solirubrobacteraceae bacterium]